MYKPYKNLKSCIRKNPEVLSLIKDPKLLDFINASLPYSVGIEVEAEVNRELLPANAFYGEFRESMGLMTLSISDYETQFRIPPGIEGFIALDKISQFLKKCYFINPSSGIHYHIDFTGYGYYLDMSSNKNKIKNILLSALDTWNYKGNYNHREINLHGNKEYVWANYRQHFSTIEVRIGEMTFDYELLVKRILHLQNVSRLIKKILSDEFFLEEKTKGFPVKRL